MTKLRTFVTFALALLLAVLPARAQFTDQRTWGGTSSGTNAITFSISNWSSNLVGVPLRFKAGGTNTGSATLNVSGLGAIAIRKQTGSGLQPLSGQEIQAGQIYTVIYDGTFWQLQSPPTATSVVSLTAT
jgi:hypothetical protein